jgi:hypothetical protein
MEGQGSIQVMDGHEGESAKTAIDSTHNLMHLACQPLILMDICASWHCNLHKQHFFSPVRILLQEHLKGQKLLWDAFNHIQTVNSQHYLFGKAPTMSRQIPKHISTADVDCQHGRQIA